MAVRLQASFRALRAPNSWFKAGTFPRNWAHALTDSSLPILVKIRSVQDADAQRCRVKVFLPASSVGKGSAQGSDRAEVNETAILLSEARGADGRTRRRTDSVDVLPNVDGWASVVAARLRMSRLATADEAEKTHVFLR